MNKIILFCKTQYILMQVRALRLKGIQVSERMNACIAAMEEIYTEAEHLQNESKNLRYEADVLLSKLKGFYNEKK